MCESGSSEPVCVKVHRAFTHRTRTTINTIVLPEKEQVDITLAIYRLKFREFFDILRPKEMEKYPYLQKLPHDLAHSF